METPDSSSRIELWSSSFDEYGLMEPNVDIISITPPHENGGTAHLEMRLPGPAFCIDRGRLYRKEISEKTFLDFFDLFAARAWLDKGPRRKRALREDASTSGPTIIKPIVANAFCTLVDLEAEFVESEDKDEHVDMKVISINGKQLSEPLLVDNYRGNGMNCFAQGRDTDCRRMKQSPPSDRHHTGRMMSQFRPPAASPTAW